MMIYKYVGHESSFELIKILKYFIEDGTVRAGCPHDFNDPAEFKVNFDFVATEEQRSKRFFELWHDKDEDACKNWLRNRELHVEQYDAYMLRRNLLNNMGVVCLTRAYDNYLMWSHYARSHSGFCIGFDDAIIEELNDKNAVMYGDVQYSETVPKVNFYTSDINEIIGALFMYKGSVWGYEEEVRVVSKIAGIKKIDKSLIKELIVGCRPCPGLENYIYTLFDTGIELYKMRCPVDSYNLERVLINKNKYFQGY